MIFPGGGASLADSAYFSAGKMIYDLAIKVSGLCADRVNDYNLVIISCRDFMICPGVGRGSEDFGYVPIKFTQSP